MRNVHLLFQSMRRQSASPDTSGGKTIGRASLKPCIEYLKYLYFKAVAILTLIVVSLAG